MKVDWKLFAQIVLAVVVFGWGWLGDNQVIVIGFVASLIVWLFNALTSRGILVNKFWKTVAVFVTAVILQVIFTPFVSPASPTWSGEFSADVMLFLSWVGDWLTVIQGTVLASMTIYNAILEVVLANTVARLSFFEKRLAG